MNNHERNEEKIEFVETRKSRANSVQGCLSMKYEKEKRPQMDLSGWIWVDRWNVSSRASDLE